MFPFLAIALQYLPELIKSLTDENKIKNSTEMKAAIDNKVKEVTQAATPSDAENKLKQTAVLAQLELQIRALDVEAQRIGVQADKDYYLAANQSTAAAQNTLLELLNKPESAWIGATPSVISYIVILGFFVLVGLMVSGAVNLPSADKGGDRLAEIIYICIGAITAGFSTVLNFWLGSSLGSRRKDSSVALAGTVDQVKEIARPPAPTPRPLPSPAKSESSVPSVGVDTKNRAALPPSLVGVGRSTDPSTVNVRKDVPWEPDRIPASIRYNNPGAQYPSREAARFGQIGYGIIGGGHKIAAFPSAVNGAASNLDLLYRNYTGMTIGEAGRKWTGRNSFGVPGYPDNVVVSREMLSDRDQAISLLRAIAGRESGKSDALTDEQWRYAHEMFRARSADAFLDQFGIDVRGAVVSVRPDGAPEELLEAMIVNTMEALGYAVDKNVDEINIVYVEGMNEDGSPNNDEPNKFNDLRCLIGFKSGYPVMLGKWNATTEPGFYYDRDNPLRKSGAARIKFGQYTAWQVGMHRGKQEALCQVKDVTVFRDLNRDMQRVGDRQDTGLFGINQHGGYDMPEENIGKASAGCLVGRTMAGHRQFMEMVKTDPRFVSDQRFIFNTTILPAGAILYPDSASVKEV